MSEQAVRRATTGQWVGRIAGPVAAALIYGIPSGLHTLPGLDHRPAAAAAVAAWMALWWFTEAVPMAWTAVLPVALFPLLGVFDTDNVAVAVGRATLPFLDPYIFLFMGGMALGAGMEQWGLHRRIALLIMRAVGTGPERLLFGMLAATAAVSLWISNTATAVMMVPIGMALLSQLRAAEGRPLEHFGAALMLAVAYGSNIGGIGTKIGSPTNSVFAGVVSRRLGTDVGFVEYMVAALPFVLIFLPLTWAVLWRWARRDKMGPGQGGDVIDRELAQLGPLSRGERTVGLVFFVAALLWIFGDPLRQVLAGPVAHAFNGFKLGGKHYEAMVAMVGALTLLVLGRLSVAALRRVPWDTLLLLGGGFALAAGIEASGLASWMTSRLSGLESLPVLVQHGVVASATILLSAIASNTATTNVMLNVLPASRPLLAVSTFAASCDFALPAGTPPNAIVFGSGVVRLPVMMRVGVLLDLLAAAVLTVYGATWVQWVLP
ncbi:DASS family sodium-coupled anion symporter [Myxococcus llanfairpwllgwyngyllgogerychwyrndrobwllllantysiliogogogochensis]|uniref:DASS family sodium-coupled anion symporter n=1 Tax=Myxococcus llanfairpwllgwyngyllgogerychwyrndrobwllllantysiliogogogochensis TaxID=2590453 RepID=A0A540X2I4_9BACT|nr:MULTISPECIES: DASS family sodium-coupled anion symporter [Myxococcus]NTX33691.1 DASS family sodium-coupled anion symporter [Myxococcus sp. CA033]TQF15430.1 DASS family sodium-coupled anion symporter [Myxococcus llanfairpwllgwyngyllgogerychwyrndrobwllllantysiliogogogochensis]